MERSAGRGWDDVGCGCESSASVLTRAPPPRAPGGVARSIAAPAAINRGHCAGASVRAYGIATPARRASTESRRLTLERRGGRAVARPRAPARAEPRPRAGSGPERAYPSLGMGSAARARYPEGWDVSRPCIVRETPSTPCSIRSSPSIWRPSWARWRRPATARAPAVRRARVPGVPAVRGVRGGRGAVSVRGLRARAPGATFV